MIRVRASGDIIRERARSASPIRIRWNAPCIRGRERGRCVSRTIAHRPGIPLVRALNYIAYAHGMETQASRSSHLRRLDCGGCCDVRDGGLLGSPRFQDPRTDQYDLLGARHRHDSLLGSRTGGVRLTLHQTAGSGLGGMSQSRRGESVWVFGLGSLASYILEASVSRGLFVTTLPIGMVALLLERWSVRKAIIAGRGKGRAMTPTLLGLFAIRGCSYICQAACW